MAAWTEDAACVNIEQQYCPAHFRRLLKAYEKHYHGFEIYLQFMRPLFCSLS